MKKDEKKFVPATADAEADTYYESPWLDTRAELESMTEFGEDPVFWPVSRQTVDRRLAYVPGSKPKPLPYVRLDAPADGLPAGLRDLFSAPPRGWEPMTALEEQAQIVAAKDGDARAFRQLGRQYSPLLRAERKRLMRQQFEASYVEAVLIEALWLSIVKFEPKTEAARLAGGGGVKLQLMIQSAANELLEQERSITVKKTALHEFVSAIKKGDDCSSSLDRADFQRVREIFSGFARLVEGDDGSEVSERVGSDVPLHLTMDPRAGEREASAETVAVAQRALSILSGRRLQAVRLVMGFETGEAMTVREAAKVIGCSKDTVARDVLEALDEMRETVRAPQTDAVEGWVVRSARPYEGRHRVDAANLRATALAKIPVRWTPDAAALRAVYTQSGGSARALHFAARRQALQAVSGRATNAVEVEVLREWVEMVTRDAVEAVIA
jgi:predicted DNA-binding protein (UPF0251 family)